MVLSEHLFKWFKQLTYDRCLAKSKIISITIGLRGESFLSFLSLEEFLRSGSLIAISSCPPNLLYTKLFVIANTWWWSGSSSQHSTTRWMPSWMGADIDSATHLFNYLVTYPKYLGMVRCHACHENITPYFLIDRLLIYCITTDRERIFGYPEVGICKRKILRKKEHAFDKEKSEIQEKRKKTHKRPSTKLETRSQPRKKL